MGAGIPYPMLPISFSIDVATLGYKHAKKKPKSKKSDAKFTVSVIIPAYNLEDSIEKTIKSIYGQTLRPKNVIVVDDCSKDMTEEICRKLKSELKGFIYIRRFRNSGKAANINYVVQNFGEFLGDVNYIIDSSYTGSPTFIEENIENTFITPESRFYNTSKFTVSVIIPAYNLEDSIEKTIKSIYGQTLRPKNVIVVDDCSKDMTEEICRKLRRELKGFIYIRRFRNSGKAANINYVVQEFENILGDIVYVIDGDCIATPRCIENLVRNFTSEDVAAVTSYGYTTPPNNLYAKVLYYGNAWNNSIFRFRKKAQEYRRAISVVCGASTAYRTKVLKAIPIPERTKTEDTDHTWLLQENGYKIVFDKDSVVYSKDLENVSSMCNQWSRWYSGTYQSTYVHGRKLIKAKKMFFTTILPGLFESVAYSIGIVTLPIIAGMILFGIELPLFTMDYVLGFIIIDFLLTVVPTFIIDPEYLQYLPHIYFYKFVGGLLTLKAFGITTFEKLTGKQRTWGNRWIRTHYKSDSYYETIHTK